jgi:hypothetical protein
VSRLKAAAAAEGSSVWDDTEAAGAVVPTKKKTFAYFQGRGDGSWSLLRHHGKVRNTRMSKKETDQVCHVSLVRF